MAKDGSCNGYRACQDATIDLVSEASCVDEQVCKDATIDLVSDASCVGRFGGFYEPLVCNYFSHLFPTAD